MPKVHGIFSEQRRAIPAMLRIFNFLGIADEVLVNPRHYSINFMVSTNKVVRSMRTIKEWPVLNVGCAHGEYLVDGEVWEGAMDEYVQQQLLHQSFEKKFNNFNPVR